MSRCVDAIGRDLGEDTGRSVPGQATLGASQAPTCILRPRRTFPGAVTVAPPNILVQAQNRACVAKDEKSEAIGRGC